MDSDDLAWAKMRFFVENTWGGSYSVLIHGKDAHGQVGATVTWFFIKKY